MCIYRGNIYYIIFKIYDDNDEINMNTINKLYKILFTFSHKFIHILCETLQ